MVERTEPAFELGERAIELHDARLGDARRRDRVVLVDLAGQQFRLGAASYLTLLGEAEG